MPSVRNVDNHRKRGFTPFNDDPWTGPGNDPFIGPLKTLTGYISRDHDNAYAMYQDRYGIDPKLYWSKADQDAIHEWEHTGEWSGRIAAYVFKAKKFLRDAGIVKGNHL